MHNGHYDLVGPDGEIILPQVWKSVVQPDWTITMHLWPIPPSPPETSDSIEGRAKDLISASATQSAQAHLSSFNEWFWNSPKAVPSSAIKPETPKPGIFYRNRFEDAIGKEMLHHQKEEQEKAAAAKKAGEDKEAARFQEKKKMLLDQKKKQEEKEAAAEATAEAKKKAAGEARKKAAKLTVLTDW